MCHTDKFQTSIVLHLLKTKFSTRMEKLALIELYLYIKSNILENAFKCVQREINVNDCTIDGISDFSVDGISDFRIG